MGIFDKIKNIFSSETHNKNSESATNAKKPSVSNLKKTPLDISVDNEEVISAEELVGDTFEKEEGLALESEESVSLSVEHEEVIKSKEVVEESHKVKGELDHEIESFSEDNIKSVDSSTSNKFSNQKDKLDQTLNKTRDGFFAKMKLFFSGKNKIDDDFLDQLEEMLITADVGVPTTVKIIDLVEKFVERNKYVDEEELKNILKKEIINLLNVDNNDITEIDSKIKPYVIIFVGVNGVGKTTSIAKIAYSLKKDGKKVLIGAADTFRAAAINQLDSWAKKIDIPIIKQDMGSDPASVAFDTVQSGISNNFDYILIDTAGRLHNKINLMQELEKINNVVKKILPTAPHEVVLVLDASTGQNALEQAKQFLKSTKVTHLALTKLDGTAKGGVVISICDQLSIPIKYIGVGEQITDIQLFNRKKFVDSLFK